MDVWFALPSLQHHPKLNVKRTEDDDSNAQRAKPANSSN
jgi:hypothetical protein